MLHNKRKTFYRIKISEGEKYLLLRVNELRQRNKNAIKCYIESD